MKNKYTKLPIPESTAWERKTWLHYIHWRIRYFIYSCKNLIDWFPVIWKDRHWDGYFITKVLQRKIELQREYLVKANRHTRIDSDNYWMTVVLNLIESEHEEYYGCEYMNYIKQDMVFIPIEDTDSYSIEFETKWEKLDEYINKYPGVKYRVIKENKGVDFTSKDRLALYMANYRQRKCRQLIFEILKQKSQLWWD